MIKKILGWLYKCSDSIKTYDPNLLKDGIKKVWSDEYTYLKPMRVDRLEWHDVKDISIYSHSHSNFLVDDGESEYPVEAWYAEYFRDGVNYFFCNYYGEMEGIPMEPQPIRFALLPKLNGND